MKILGYDEVDPQQVLELNLTCFGWMLTPEQVRAIRRVDKRCPDYFALYAVEKGRVLSQVGSVIVETQMVHGTERIGFIWGVATRPDSSRRRYAMELIEESHRRLLAEDIRYSVLGTGRSLVAHSLYEKLGYADFSNHNLGIKLCKPRKTSGSDVIFKPETDNDTFLMLFKEYSKDLFGFVCRPENFIEVRNAWSWMMVNTKGTFLENGRPIGFGLGNKYNELFRIKEISCPLNKDIGKCIGALESKFKPRYMLFDWMSRSSVINEYARSGFSCIEEAWGVVMAKDLHDKDNIEAIRRLYGAQQDRFQMTSIDEY